MLPNPISRSGPIPNDTDQLRLSDLTRVLEQHVEAGFPPDLALDLVLNELVVRAADATHASAAALALVRGDEMVCRAATGLHAPDLGVPLNTRDGLSGACVRNRSPQICNDADSDPRVDPVASRQLGIQSTLIVPVFEHPSNRAADEMPYGAAKTAGLSGGTLHTLPLDTVPANGAIENDESGEDPKPETSAGLPVSITVNNVSEIRPQLAGVLEVFSPLPNAFSSATQAVLEEFARECARIRNAASNLQARPPADLAQFEDDLDAGSSEVIPPAVLENDSTASAHRSAADQPYQGWTLSLAALVILAAATLSFLIGSRLGWLRPAQPGAAKTIATSQLLKPASDNSSATFPASSPAGTATKSAVVRHTAASARGKTGSNPSTASSEAKTDELVVYEKGKVVFRMPSEHDSSREPAIVQAATPSKVPSDSGIAKAVWLAPEEAENLLLNRVEPEYPPKAIAAHRSGSVVLEVQVSRDGSVASVKTMSGDPLLATAATQAVRSWRYQPYRLHEQASPFQTDVTLTFSLPN
jgi:TonB family protein